VSNFDQQIQTFSPERKQGLLLHILILIILLPLMVAAIWIATNQAEGSFFVLVMILIILLTVLIPTILYRGYALINARYILERDGLRLRWGLRTEDIPLTDIEWVRRANESGYSVQMPVFAWPGAILGERINENLGAVEFIASDSSKLILIVTHSKVYAISPQNPREFEMAFQRSFEMGSLFPIQSSSSKPAAFIMEVLSDKYAKFLLPLNVILTLLLWLVSGFIIANHQQLPLGFSSQGTSLDMVSSQRLLLIPIMGLLVMVMNIILGLFFIRRAEYYLISYLLWVGGVITPILLMVGMIILSIWV